MKLAVSLLPILIGLAVAAPAGAADRPRVYLVSIDRQINPELAAYVRRAFARAEGDGARAIVVIIDTPGGFVTSALAIKDTILESKVPVYAFVQRHAYSAGALAAIAADKIYVAPGSAFGAATPVYSDGSYASEKWISAMSAVFRATAEVRGRNPRLAAAMVDERIAVPGLTEPGELLTLTHEEARAWGYADGVTTGVRDLLAAEGIQDPTFARPEPSSAEWLVAQATSSAGAAILLAIGVLGLLLEVKTGGVGAGGILSAAAISAFLWAHAVSGSAGGWAIALVVVGAICLLAEVLIPGVTVFGLVGGMLLLGGVFSAMNGDLSFSTAERMLDTGGALGGAIALITAGAFVMVRLLSRGGGRGGLVLRERV